MRINEYNTLSEFVAEYSHGRQFSWETEDAHEGFIGIEFNYHGKFYRMCREPMREEERTVLPDGKLGYYHLMQMHCEKKGYPIADKFETIAWFSDIEALLYSDVIEETKFSEVIMDDETEILSKD